MWRFMRMHIDAADSIKKKGIKKYNIGESTLCHNKHGYQHQHQIQQKVKATTYYKITK